ncbi:YybH family protein [Chitinophaga barathri]|uniref:Nuclear transport factor 2 family protein n=1 Tax=Chitinophaga barathri TaxID=1647451 RepID=A0A3N4MBH9_9BACT|nr:nuclear transport factor 2 family protein [Chitinophaga barathri]RPD39136.1 nuclear transport factor 2 family protein [Chitinophaga barathri]
MKTFNLFICFALSVWMCGCAAQAGSAPDKLEEAKKAIAESNAVYFQAFAKGDSSIFIDRYAKDCCIMTPGMPALCGKDAAATFFRIAYDKVGLRNGKFTTTAVYGDGIEYVTEEGLWQSFDAGNKMFDNGKFLVLWKKTPEGWKMYRDSFSSNLPPG